MAAALGSTVPCAECDNLAAKFHCDTCGKALCAQCKANHLRNKVTRHHVVVEYANKLHPKYLISLVCHTHNTSDPELWCDTCGVPICLTCITEKHKGHQFSKITAVLSQKRDGMREEMKELRDKTVGHWEDILEQAKQFTADHLKDIEDIEKELLARAKAMHNEVDAILKQARRALQEMTKPGLDQLKQQEKYVANHIQQMKADVQKYEDKLRDADPNAVLQFKPGSIQPRDSLPSLSKALVPIFTKGQNDTESMQIIFGQLSKKSNTAAKNPSTSHSKGQIDTSDSGKTVTPNELSGSSSGATQKSLKPDSRQPRESQSSLNKASVPIFTKGHLIPNPSVQSEFDVDCSYPCIACVEGGLAWVETDSYKLQLMDRRGSVKDTIRIDFDFLDMTLTSDGDLLLPDFDNSCIKSVSRNKTITTLFSTSWKPYSLCSLQNSDIVVAFRNDSKVIVYSREGNIRLMLDHIKFRYPMKVAVNKVNQDIYICDHESDNYKSPGKLIAVGTDGQLRHEYTGQGGSVNKFAPVGMCTDQMGHVLIADINNHRVYILDQEGRFIRYILAPQHGLHQPTTIDVDRDGYVWVGECAGFRGHVKVAKYLH